jgi:hypothetical protein
MDADKLLIIVNWILGSRSNNNISNGDSSKLLSASEDTKCYAQESFLSSTDEEDNAEKPQNTKLSRQTTKRNKNYRKNQKPKNKIYENKLN